MFEIGLSSLIYAAAGWNMAQRKRMAYNVSRDILDEETLDEIAEKADSNPSLCDKLKKSLR